MSSDSAASEQRLRLPYLGRRGYLHGTTLFDALRQLAPTDARLSFKFSRMIHSDRVRVAEGGDPGAFDASLSWRTGSSAGLLGVIRETPSPEPERVPYDEEAVTREAVLEDRAITFAGMSPFSLVATIVPLHKALLLRHELGTPPGQWVFTRLELDRDVSVAGVIRVAIQSAFANKLVKSAVSVDGTRVGEIYFSWLN